MTDKLVINEHMDMRWHEGKPMIFIHDVPFIHCAYLVVTVNPADPENERATVDDLAARPGARAMEGKDAIAQFGLTKDEVLWGFYSSIVGWYESGYNTEVLHTNLAFPLLKQLARVGDERAKRALRGEITDRLRGRNPNTAIVLVEECASMFDDEDWRLVLAMLKARVANGIDLPFPSHQTNSLGRAIASALAAGPRRLKLGPDRADIVDALADLHDASTGVSLAFSMSSFDRWLADRVAERLSEPEWEPKVRESVATNAASPGILAKLIRNGTKVLDAVVPIDLRAYGRPQAIELEWKVLEEAFGNKATTPELLAQGLKAILKKDTSSFDVDTERLWLGHEIPAIEAALKNPAATEEHASIVVESPAFKRWLKQHPNATPTRELICSLSRLPSTRRLELPLVPMFVEHFKDLHLVIRPGRPPYDYKYLVRQGASANTAFHSLDEAVAAFAWMGLDLPKVFAGATMRARLLRAEQDSPNTSIPLSGSYTIHDMVGNIAGLKAFAKERGLKFMRLLSNGRYTTAYYEVGHAYLLNVNCGREEWTQEAGGGWKRVSSWDRLPASPSRKAQEYLYKKNEWDPW